MTVTCPNPAAGRTTVAPGGTVVVVEDRLVSNLVRAVLRKHGYEVTLAEAADAAALIRAHDPKVGVLITNTPADFLEFADSVPLLYLSSQPDCLLEAAFHACRVVVKPFQPHDLADAVDLLMAPG